MKKICFHIQKGGVGKTSLSGNVADCMARRGHKTLLVDCDMQGNASSWLCPKGMKYDIGDVLSEKAKLDQAILQRDDHLSILPVIAIGGYLKEWSETQLFKAPKSFEFLNSDIESRGFEFVVYDCSPSFSQLERSIIAEVDEVVNPLSPEFFSMDGIEIFQHELRNIERVNRKKIKNDKIVVNMVNKSFTRHKAILNALLKLEYTVFTVPQDSKIAESQLVHQSLFDYAPSAKSLAVIEEIATALMVK